MWGEPSRNVQAAPEARVSAHAFEPVTLGSAQYPYATARCSCGTWTLTWTADEILAQGLQTLLDVELALREDHAMHARSRLEAARNAERDAAFY